MFIFLIDQKQSSGACLYASGDTVCLTCSTWNAVPRVVSVVVDGSMIRRGRKDSSQWTVRGHRRASLSRGQAQAGRGKVILLASPNIIVLTRFFSLSVERQ
jgi:hypothetical protein